MHLVDILNIRGQVIESLILSHNELSVLIIDLRTTGKNPLYTLNIM